MESARNLARSDERSHRARARDTIEMLTSARTSRAIDAATRADTRITRAQPHIAREKKRGARKKVSRHDARCDAHSMRASLVAHAHHARMSKCPKSRKTH
jgi:hypothetical protein